MHRGKMVGSSSSTMRSRGFERFWNNYQRAQEWSFGRKAYFLESKMKALEIENALLHNFIMRKFQYNNVGVQLSDPVSRERFPVQDNVSQGFSSIEYEENNEDYEFSEADISEELLAFYEQTARHKIEHRKHLAEEKEKQAEEDQFRNNDEIQSKSQLSLSHISEDMSLLYGDAAAKISSMELSMQINFDSNRVKTNASLWPNIPLRLSSKKQIGLHKF